ncbi:D-2-hydroxyacid dehydrogenase [Gluconobacter sphaericus]|uniref:D-2-hydroxyacid dehydrogenase n=1 Tax=Gluconobacter sphaericus TaxID=574987 RepID=UPI00312B976D
MFWIKDRPALVSAHPIYDITAALPPDAPVVTSPHAFTEQDLRPLLVEAEVLCISMMWRDEFLDLAPNLKMIQSISAGVDHFPMERLKERNIPLCTAGGTNSRTVAEHTLAFLLNISRRLYAARDDQKVHHWNPPRHGSSNRQQELKGKHVGIIGYGKIGSTIGELCGLLGMKVTAVRRSLPEKGNGQGGVETVLYSDLGTLIPDLDFVVLSCPLTPQTEGLVDMAFLERMKPSAWLVNVARGRVVREKDLISALDQNLIGGTALDTFETEPLPKESPLWAMSNVIVTPHNAGDSEKYAPNVAKLLLENIRRFETDEPLINRVV